MDRGDIWIVVFALICAIFLPFILNILVFGKESVVLYDLKKFRNRLLRRC